MWLVVLSHRCPGSPAECPKRGWRQVDAEIDQEFLAIFGHRPFTLKREKGKKTYLVTLRENESIVPYAQYAPAGSHLSVFLPIQLSIYCIHPLLAQSF